MSMVSVGSVENIEQEMFALEQFAVSMTNSIRYTVESMNLKLSEVEDVALQSAGMLEKAVEYEGEMMQALIIAKAQYDMAVGEVESAERNLSYAQGALAAATGGILINPTALFTGAVAAAGAAVEIAESSLNAAMENLYQAEYDMARAEENLEHAAGQRANMERRNEMSQNCLALTRKLQESVNLECEYRHREISSLLQTGILRLTHARNALENYLRTNSNAAAFHKWLKWSPEKTVEKNRPELLRERINLPSEQRKLFVEYLIDTDSDMRTFVNSFRKELEDSCGQVERHLIFLKMRGQLGEMVTEKLIEKALCGMDRTEEMEKPDRAVIEKDCWSIMKNRKGEDNA